VTGTWKPDSGNGKKPGHVLADFIADCADGSLPAVSWIVAPYGYCEHPEARPLNGAVYTQAVLNALWANQELWNSTVVLITYDENDGLFDHVPPPMPPAGTAGEFVGGEPIGLGPRVPMTVISPWSRGGWVNSQVFDHTSVIRFIESWQHPGVPFPNITRWRRSICGDLTGCFDFTAPNTGIPSLPTTPTHAVAPGDPDDPERGLPAAKPPPLNQQTPPVQDPGQRNARPLPYQLTAATLLSDDHNTLTTIFTNTGNADVALSAHRADGQTDGPWPYVVPAGGAPQTDTWRIQAYGGGKYHIAIHAPNRFLWEFAGDANSAAAGVEVTASYTGDGRLLLSMHHKSSSNVTITIAANHYRSDGPWTYDLVAGGSIDTESWNLAWFDGWYDLSATTTGDPAFLRRFTGHYENGSPSKTG
jgi:phospholipase C